MLLSSLSMSRVARMLLALGVIAFTAQVARPATLQTFYSNATPPSGLLAAPDGNFYGTSRYGGTYDEGTVFKLSSAGVYQLLYSFTGGSDGANPCATLTIGPDGLLYGTCQYGGNQNAGSIFKITPAGGFTPLRALTAASDGGEPIGGLVVGTNKLLYGTASSGGSAGRGTVFLITTNGAFTNRYNFAGSDGNNPAGLSAGSDGRLYGVTQYGGTNNYGTIFKITTGGTFTPLFSFGQTNGEYPADALVQGPDGAFYGSTTYGGADNFGTIFKITAAGIFSTVYTFTQENLGSNPSGGLAFDPNYNLNGSAAYGGANDFGSLFSVTTGGAYTSLYDFTGNNDGANPVTHLARNGYSFYGTTASGGTVGGGAVFDLTLLHFNPMGQFLPNRKLVFSGSGGTSNGDYSIFTTTNNGGPRVSWTYLAAGQFNANGQFSFTNTLASDVKRLYYIQLLP